MISGSFKEFSQAKNKLLAQDQKKNFLKSDQNILNSTYSKTFKAFIKKQKDHIE